MMPHLHPEMSPYLLRQPCRPKSQVPNTRWPNQIFLKEHLRISPQHAKPSSMKRKTVKRCRNPVPGSSWIPNSPPLPTRAPGGAPQAPAPRARSSCRRVRRIDPRPWLGPGQSQVRVHQGHDCAACILRSGVWVVGLGVSAWLVFSRAR